MEIKITKRYMELPVSSEAQKKTLFFSHNEKIMCELISRVDTINPTSYQYVDMKNLSGRVLKFCIEPEMDFIPVFKDYIPEAPEQTYRPVTHFSPKRGWMSNPCGLMWYEGKYHMFFQHNPADTCWGNVHWGHAVSEDLMHWKELGEALFPDDMGVVFPGCGVADVDNVTGLKENEHIPILLYYTAAAVTHRAHGQKFTQCMAYSVDGGYTFRKYENNPILQHLENTNRDPKIVYVESEKLWYMILWLTVDSRFALFTSSDLISWSFAQEIVLPKNNESPDMFPLTTDKGNTYWVICCASDRYLVGQMKNKRFHVVEQSKMLSYNGKKSYGGQTFWGVPDGRRIRVAWNRSRIPSTLFANSMTSFTELKLIEYNGSFILCANPVKEYDTLAQSEEIYSSYTGEITLRGKSHNIMLELSASGVEPITISFLGLEIFLYPGVNRLEADETFFINDMNRYESDRMLMPLFIRDGKITLQIITDVHSTEIYAGGGMAFACIEHISDYNLNRLGIEGEFEKCKISVKNMISAF